MPSFDTGGRSPANECTGRSELYPALLSTDQLNRCVIRMVSPWQSPGLRSEVQVGFPRVPHPYQERGENSPEDLPRDAIRSDPTKRRQLLGF